MRWASNAEASRTDAAASLLATETPSFLCGFAIFSAGFRASIRDQLVSQAFARRQVSEHASGPLYCRSTLNGGFIGFGGMRHALEDTGVSNTSNNTANSAHQYARSQIAGLPLFAHSAGILDSLIEK
ncbi:MAG TPA: hypothetical protein VFX35_06075 [Solirubrobacterales bacterium]|nr:hypothetical protein [Solirubrobacterales bacterium]